MGNHVFGCDICQDVCPWNRKAPVAAEEAFAARNLSPSLAGLAGITETEFRERFRETPLWRAKYGGFLRNVAVAMGNCGDDSFLEPLTRIASSAYKEAASHASWACRRIRSRMNR